MMRRVGVVVGLLLALGLAFALGARRTERQAAMQPAETTTQHGPRRAVEQDRALHPPPKPQLFRLPPANRAARALRSARDAEPAVRAHAMAELAHGTTRDSGLLILQGIRDESELVSEMAAGRAGAALAAGTVTPSEIDVLARDVELPRKTRILLVNSLGRMQSAEATRLLLDLAETGDEEERRNAMALLPNQGLEIAAPALVAGLADADRWVRYNAHEQLQRLGEGHDFGEDPQKWSEWLRQEGVDVPIVHAMAQQNAGAEPQPAQATKLLP